MKTLRTFAVALSLVAMAAVTAGAAPTIGVYFDDQMASTQTAVDPNEPFDIYVIMSTVDDRIDAVEYKLNLPSQVAVMNTNYGGANPLDLGSSQHGTLLGLGNCQNIYDGLQGFETFVVAHLEAIAVTTFDATPITLTKYTGGAEAPSVNAPRYSSCDNNVVEMETSNAQLTGGVATFSSSFGSVKALYE